MKLSEVLEKSLKIIANRDRWTKCRGAANKDGATVTPKAVDAYCFCSSGILERIAPDNSTYGKAYDFMNTISYRISGVGLIAYNDHSSHEKVCDLWQTGIELAKAKGL
jgi:hypothetical protein